jgi:hypothetical protein
MEIILLINIVKITLSESVFRWMYFIWYLNQGTADTSNTEVGPN